MTTPIDTLVASVVSLYRRTMDGEDVEHLDAKLSLPLMGRLRFCIGAPSYRGDRVTLYVDDCPGAILAQMPLPAHGIRDGFDDGSDIADAREGAMKAIAHAALAISDSSGVAHCGGIDPLSLLVRIYRECAASQVEAERLEQVAAAEEDGGAA